MRHLWRALLVLIVILAASAACIDLPSPISSFRSDRPKITRGQSAKLTAVFDSGVGTIDNGVGVIASGETKDTPVLTENKTFTLTVTLDTGEVASQSVDVGVVDLAQITSFKADKVYLPGQVGAFTAVFSGGKGVVDQGIGPVESGVSKSVGVLQATKIYTLSVTNEAGDAVTAKAEVEAAVTPVIASFSVPGPGSVVGRYAPALLTAVYAGGHGVIDQGVGPIDSMKPTPSKEVPAEGTTWTLTVTNGLGEKVSKTLTVTTKKEMFVTNYDGDVLVFDADVTGDVPPKRKIKTREGKNAGSGITGLLGILVTNDSIFVANENGLPSISIFGIADREDAVPRGKLSGGAGWMAGTKGPYLISMAGGELFVPDKSATIEVWNTTDTGAVPPKRKIEGAATKLDNCFGTWVDNGELYVSNNANGGLATVTVYPQTASGNVAPTRTFPLTAAVPSGVLVSGNELFISSADAVTVLDKTTGALLREIKGAATRLEAQAVECSISDDEIYCASDINNEVVIFPTTASGNVAPKRIVGGPKSTLEACGTVIVF